MCSFNYLPARVITCAPSLTLDKLFLEKKPLNLQLVTKIIETHYIFMKKSLEMLYLFKDTQNSPYISIKCCAKSRKVIPGVRGQ